MDQLFRKQFRRLERIKNRSAYYIQENVRFLILAALIIIAFIYSPTINFNTVSPVYYGHKTFGILIVVFIFICIMVVSKLYNIKFKKKPKKVKKVIIIEKMKNKDFCSRKSVFCLCFFLFLKKKWIFLGFEMLVMEIFVLVCFFFDNLIFFFFFFFFCFFFSLFFFPLRGKKKTTLSRQNELGSDRPSIAGEKKNGIPLI